jgi:hypothetical protein
MRISTRKIRNLSRKQADLLAPPIDRGEVRLEIDNEAARRLTPGRAAVF